MAESSIELPVISLTVYTPPTGIYRAYLNAVIAVADHRLSDLDKDVIEECFQHCNGNFDTEGRKIICKRLGITNANLNNYIKKLRDEKYINEENQLVPMLNYKPLLLQEDVKSVSAKIVFNIKPPKTKQ